ncbi:hypothetical protein IG631_05910 [Alternaria alternata]|nr:hypothetical protein IG631_05910 [Alternaria alternata]
MRKIQQTPQTGRRLIGQLHAHHVICGRQQLFQRAHEQRQTVRPSATNVIGASQNGIPFTLCRITLHSDMSARSREFNVA